jgi:hypothetical protein
MTSAIAKKLLLAIFLFALGAVAQATDPKMVGTWTQEGQAAATWIFRPDGSGFMEQSNPRTTARFTWTCQGQILKVSAAGLSVPYTVLSNDGNSLVIRNDQVSTVLTLKKKS